MKNQIIHLFLKSILSVLVIPLLFYTCTEKSTDQTKVENNETGPALQSLSITPPSATMSAGLTANFTATAVYSDGTSADITTQATWVSSDSSIATISGDGVATGIAAGETSIYAIMNEISSDTAAINVTNAMLNQIEISADTSSTPRGLTIVFTAIGYFSDASSGIISGSVVWQSGSADIISINASGIATGLNTGSSSITASLDGINSNSVTVNVTAPILSSLLISPATMRIESGTSAAFTISGIMSDGTSAILNNVLWSSSDASIATIAGGNATGVTPGNATIKASVNSIFSEALLTVILPQVPPIADAGINQFKPTGSLVTLNGGTSSDANGDPLTYSWTLTSAPVGSMAVLSDTTIFDPTFVADMDGVYSASLVVNDGKADSNMANVIITVAPACTTSSVVISQIYGAGGNAGAVYNKDFIELHNRSIASIDIGSWSIHYGSATGTSWSALNLSGVIPAGGYFLISLAGGTTGAALPAPDFTGTINMSATNGKITLTSNANVLSACPAGISDLIGYGTANCWEGTAPASAASAATSLSRNNAACDDTNDNSLDFTSGPPQPRNSASPANSCGCL